MSDPQIIKSEHLWPQLTWDNYPGPYSGSDVVEISIVYGSKAKLAQSRFQGIDLL